MLALYIVAAIIGGGLVLISALTGGHGHGDHDFSHDHDFSSDHDLSGDNPHVDHVADNVIGPDWAMWLPFLSLRFWTYALATFGLIGWASEALTSTASPTVLTVSIICGVVMGAVVATVMRYLMKTTFDSGARTADLLGVEGRVTVPVNPGLDGKVRLTVKGDTIDFLALSNDDRILTAGEEVVVVAVENDRLRVIPKTDIFQELP